MRNIRLKNTVLGLSCFLIPGLLLVVSTVSAQPSPGTSDMFPLAVGNTWEYSYYFESAHAIEQSSHLLDSGNVDLTIKGSSVFADSIVWHFVETAVYRRRFSRGPAGLVLDTTVTTEVNFDMREDLSGDHALHSFSDSKLILFIFPSDVYQPYDTMVVNRYAAPDSLGLKYYSRPSTFIPNLVYSRNLVFREGVGLERMDFARGFFEYGSDTSSAQLITQTLVNVQPVREEPLPRVFALSQNYPNPFNPTTTIRYGLPHRSHVILTVFNTLGQQVSQLINGEIESGNHEIPFNANNLASGVYFYIMQAGSYVETKSLCILK